MTEETRPGFLANYKIVRPGPVRFRPGQQFKKLARARPGAARIRPGWHLIYITVHCTDSTVQTGGKWQKKFIKISIKFINLEFSTKVYVEM